MTEAHPSEPVYNGINLDGRLSRSMTYMGFHPNNDPLGSLLKDENHPCQSLEASL